ncbi:MAG TPA: enoyl-CoA hydratase/isomerase family protein [Candidatus Cybelea sp.]|nr:enoyl-CoA hydratase/isomerase family protein [Candidatus Cybelea sp.]
MSLIVETSGGMTALTLDRPEVHNAFDEALIAALTEAFTEASNDSKVRAVVLRANGKSFSAGADLNWMKRMAGFSEAENLADAQKLAELLRVIDTCPKPVIARVHGNAFAGAIGLIACSDLVAAVPEAEFAVTEVRLGLIPAVISPYLIRVMGARQARRWFLTAERFSAGQAQQMNLVHEVVDAGELDACVMHWLDAIQKAGPNALAAAKQLVAAVDPAPDTATIADTARRIAAIRASDEGKEGVSSFLEKRKPRWVP